jgi:hypothetical protein
MVIFVKKTGCIYGFTSQYCRDRKLPKILFACRDKCRLRPVFLWRLLSLVTARREFAALCASFSATEASAAARYLTTYPGSRLIFLWVAHILFIPCSSSSATTAIHSVLFISSANSLFAAQLDVDDWNKSLRSSCDLGLGLAGPGYRDTIPAFSIY